MRKVLLSSFLIFLIFPALTDSPKAASEAIEGKNLHLKILARHPKLDKFYRSPLLFGSATSTPMVTISLPIEDWKKLTAKEKNLLAAYVSSLIKTVQANPLKYTQISPSAPAASQIISNASRMTEKSWQIMAGSFSADGRDIFSDSIVLSGVKTDSESKQPSPAPKSKAIKVKPMSKHDTDILARKMAVATYFEQLLKKEYMMALVTVQGSKDEILQVSLIRITPERCNSILRSGLYTEAKKARFSRIVFVGADQEKYSFIIQ